MKTTYKKKNKTKMCNNKIKFFDNKKVTNSTIKQMENIMSISVAAHNK